MTYAKNVGRPDGDGGRDKDDDILVSFISFGTGDSFTWKYKDIPQHLIVTTYKYFNSGRIPYSLQDADYV